MIPNCSVPLGAEQFLLCAARVLQSQADEECFQTAKRASTSVFRLYG